MIKKSFTSQNLEGADIAIGAPVASMSGGVHLAADGDATRSPAIGLVQALSKQNNYLSLASTGFLRLNNWALITGTATLVAFQSYYLSAVPGQLTNAPADPTATQLIGTAATPQILQVRIGERPGLAPVPSAGGVGLIEGATDEPTSSPPNTAVPWFYAGPSGTLYRWSVAGQTWIGIVA